MSSRALGFQVSYLLVMTNACFPNHLYSSSQVLQSDEVNRGAEKVLAGRTTLAFGILISHPPRAFMKIISSLLAFLF